MHNAGVKGEAHGPEPPSCRLRHSLHRGRRRRRARTLRRAPGGRALPRARGRGACVHQERMDHVEPLHPRSGQGRSRPQVPAPGRPALARVPAAGGGSRRRGGRAQEDDVGGRPRAHRAARVASGTRDAQRPGAPLPASPLRRARGALQRDVRLGQLLHPGGPARGRRDGARARHDLELPVRDRALRHHPQREPDVLHDALAATVPHRDDPRRLREDRRQGVAAAHAARDRVLLPVLDDGAASRSRDGALALLRPRRRAGGGGPERRKGRAGPHALRPHPRALPRPSGRGQGRLRRRPLLRPQERPPDRPLLQGRPLDARVRLRPFQSLRPLQRGRHPLRARVPQHAPLPHGDGGGADRGHAGQPRPGGGVAGRLR